MELYSDFRQNNRRERHYKSKSAATVSEATHKMHLSPGLYLNTSPYSNDNFNVKRHNHRHHKNSRTMHHHTPYHLPLIVPKKIKHKHKRYKSQNPPRIHLPKDYKAPPQIINARHKNTRHRRYRVPTNTPYHTPQKSHIIHNKKMVKKKKKKRKKRALSISSSSSRPLSLRVNATNDISPSTSIDNDMERECSNNSNVPMIGVPDLELIRKKRRKRIAKQRRMKMASSLSNNTHCSLRILCSVSSISTLSHLNKYGDIESLGVIICYIDSFNHYFGSNMSQLGHGGQGSIFKVDNDNVIKSYEIGSLGLYREIFALNNILGKDIQVYIETKTENKKAFIKFPLIRGENLMEYAQDLINNKKTSLRECHLQALFGQLFVSLFYLHSKGLIHRDIKIENVMVRENGEIEFIDFGHAIYIGHNLNEDHQYKLKWIKGNTEIFGTDCVLSPELKYAFYDLNHDQYIEYGTEIDFYSIGIMAVEIIYNIFDHSYQHSKWIQLLEHDIASNGTKSGLSLKCIKFIYGLIKTNPKKRLKIHEILNHPFLTEEVHDKLGYDNWYSDNDDYEDDIECDDTPDLPPIRCWIDDTAGSLPDINNVNIKMNINDFECMVKQELVKHKITLICNALMDKELSYHPRIQHLNKLIIIINECVEEKDSIYPDIASFVLAQFHNSFNFQLRNYPNHSKSKCTYNKSDKINKKTLSLHKKLYQIIIEFTNHYKTEFIALLDKYIYIMLDFNGIQHKLNDDFIGCMHRIIKVYSFQYDTFLLILQIINVNIKQRNNSIKMKRLCISFVDFILMQYLKRKNIAEIKLINNPTILTVIESIIKYGFNHSWMRTESQALLKTFTILDKKMDKMNINKKKSLDIPRYAPLKQYCVTPQVEVSHKRHIKKNKSMDYMQNSLHYISFAYPPPNHNKDGFVLESTSEIHHFDDICAAAK